MDEMCFHNILPVLIKDLNGYPMGRHTHQGQHQKSAKGTNTIINTIVLGETKYMQKDKK
jgi:hypothetical protein